MYVFVHVCLCVSDCLVLYSGQSLGESYSSSEMQSVYSTARADWAILVVNFNIYFQVIYIYIYILYDG